MSMNEHTVFEDIGKISHLLQIFSVQLSFTGQNRSDLLS